MFTFYEKVYTIIAYTFSNEKMMNVLPIKTDLDLLSLIKPYMVDLIEIESLPIKDDNSCNSTAELSSFFLSIRLTQSGADVFLKDFPYLYSFLQFNTIKVTIDEFTNISVTDEFLKLAQLKSIELKPSYSSVMEKYYNCYFIGDIDSYFSIDNENRYFINNSTYIKNYYPSNHYPLGETLEDYLEMYEMSNHKEIRFKIRNKIFDRLFSRSEENGKYIFSSLLNNEIKVEIGDLTYTIYVNDNVLESNIGDITNVVDSIAEIVLQDEQLFNFFIGDLS